MRLSRSFLLSVVTHVLVIGLALTWNFVAPEGPGAAPDARPLQRIRLVEPRPLRWAAVRKAQALAPVQSTAPAAAPGMPAPPVNVAPVAMATPVPVPPQRLLLEPTVEAPAAQVLPVRAPEVNLADHKLPVKTGTFEGEAAPAARAARSTVAAAGFGESSAAGAGRGRAAVAVAGFGETTTGASPARVARASVGLDFGAVGAGAPVRTRPVEVAREAAFVPVEILDKPRPVYPEAARRARVQGAVAVRVVFSAAGSVRVLAVVRGLGHGLDEAASEAAARIRFRPATRNGQPVDEAAVVQIVFELA